MIIEEMYDIYNPWCILQQPVHPENGMNASFRTLLAAIDQGWRVIEPVQALPSARWDNWTYYWVLSHPSEEQTSIIFVPAIQEVECFIEQSHYQVIEGSFY